MYFLVSVEKILVIGNRKQAEGCDTHVFLKMHFLSKEQGHFDTYVQCLNIQKQLSGFKVFDCSLGARVSQKASPVLLWTWRWHRVSQPSASFSSMRSLVKVHRSHKFAGKMG